MIEANRYKLGLFVTTGVFIFVIALFYLGLSELFEKKVHFATFFTESVQGLDVGSPVKYKGVPIGKVNRITIRVEDKLIRVEMEARLSAFTAEKKPDKSMEKHFYSFVSEEIKNGLRCQLVYAGITGMKFIEIDYFDPSKLPPPAANIDSIAKDAFVIPAAPSAFKDILKLINESLEKISKMKFDEISDQLVDAIKTANGLLKDPKLEKIISNLEGISRELEGTVSSVNKAVTEEKIKELVNELSQSMKSFNKLAVEAHEQLEKAKIPETSGKFRDAAESVTQARQAIVNTLMKLDQTLDSITELINYLDDDPSSVLKGKSKPEMLNNKEKDEDFSSNMKPVRTKKEKK